MYNSINKDKILSNLVEINQLTEQTKTSLNNMDSLIKENKNTNKGIWDGESAEEYLKEWNKLAEEIPSIIEIFEQQATNLNTLLTEIKKAE